MTVESTSLAKRALADEFIDVLDDKAEPVLDSALDRFEVSESELDDVLGHVDGSEPDRDSLLRRLGWCNARDIPGCGEPSMLSLAAAVFLDLRTAARPCSPIETSNGS